MSDTMNETPDTPDDVILSVKNLVKTFHTGLGFKRKEIHALRGISFNLRKGRALALVGESGSGKSTVARVLTKMYAATSGEIRLNNKNLDEYDTREELLAYRRAVQMIFQDPFGSLNPAHKVFHHIARPLRCHGKVKNKADLKQQVFNILEQVELDPEITAYKYPHELSGGQRQRVALGRTLAVDADIVLADEPTSMLDVSIRIDVLNLLKRMKDDADKAFLYITHDIATARYFAEDIAVLYQGQIVEWGKTGEVIDNPQHPYTKLLLSAVPDARIRFDEITKEQLYYIEHADEIRKISAKTVTEVKKINPNHFMLQHEFSMS